MSLFRHARRCLHTCTNDVRHSLRELLRDTAQSVAVVTTRLPSTSSYHGATLSSFASIALDPLPLVAFSLRVPSRMASALNAHFHTSASLPTPLTPPAHLVINILSAAQPHLADRFARPDIHPRPFADPCVRWTAAQDDGPPVLAGALGALACRLVCPSVPLARLGADGSESGSGPHGHACDDALALGAESGEKAAKVPHASAGGGLASELFIARVLHVEQVPLVENGERDAELYKLPLLYHRRRYTTVEDLAESIAPQGR